MVYTQHFCAKGGRSQVRRNGRKNGILPTDRPLRPRKKKERKAVADELTALSRPCLGAAGETSEARRQVHQTLGGRVRQAAP